MKLWHDDIRRPPDDSWYWARTNRDAVRFLLEAWARDVSVTEASLDHDLGFHEHDPDGEGAWLLRGDGEETGVDLVKAMIALAIVPPKVTIHSWNPEGARYMEGLLMSFTGAEVALVPYRSPEMTDAQYEFVCLDR